MNLVIYSRPSPQQSPWGQRKVAVAERWPLWGGMGVIWHLFFYGGATIFPERKCLFLACKYINKQNTSINSNMDQ